MIAGVFLLGWNCRELDDLRLREDFLGDFLGVCPCWSAGFVVGASAIVVAPALFLVRLGRFLRGGFVAGGVGAGFFLRRLLGFFRLTLWQEIDVECLRQLSGADIRAGFDVEDLLGLALLVAHDAAVDRL